MVRAQSGVILEKLDSHLETHGRCIAIDLIGMGDSEKLEDFGDPCINFVSRTSPARANTAAAMCNSSVS